MSRAIARALAIAGLALAACGGNPNLGGPCSTHCDCTRTDAPSKCVGEWLCNANKTCEYTCQSSCAGPVSTCPADSPCNGTICSARKCGP